MSLLQPPPCLSQCSRPRASQTLALCAAFSRFGGIWNSDKPKGASAPSSIVLRFQRGRVSELLFEVQVVQVLTVTSLLRTAEPLLLEHPLVVEAAFAIRIDFCYYSHNFDDKSPSHLKPFGNM